MSLKETLTGMQGLWDKSEKAYDSMFGGAKVPAATYDARLTKCHLKTANATGNPYIGREFTILEGEQEGAKVYDRIMLHNETGPVFARRFIDQCGEPQPKKASDLEKLIDKIDGAELDFQIQVKHNGDFLNVSILKTLSEVAESETEEGTEEETAEEETEEADDGLHEEDTEEDDSARQALIVFARSWDVAVEDDVELEELKSEMARYAYEEEKMTAEEIELLESNDLSDAITRKPKAAAKKAAPPAAAKKSTPPASAKKPIPGKKPLPGKKK